jgi:phosphopantetheinyl transferase
LSILSNNPDCQRKRERKEVLRAEARNILSRLADRPFTEDAIATDGQGRPFFSEGNLDTAVSLRRVLGCGVDFSISHSGSLAAVSLVTGTGIRTGCDVELVRPRGRAGKIAEQFFSAAERDYIFFQGCFDETKFYEIWTLKECYIKLRGLSVFDMPAVPSFIRDGNFVFDAAGTAPLSFCLYELGGSGERYVLAAAVEGTEAEQPEIQWFSPAGGEGDVSLSCISIAKIKAALSPADTVRPKM